MKRLMFGLALCSLLAVTKNADAQSVNFNNQPVLKWHNHNGQLFPVYNPGAIQLPGKVPPYIIPRGVLDSALNNSANTSPDAYVIGSPAWQKKILDSLPKNTAPSTTGTKPGYKWVYKYEFGPDGRYRLVPRLVWRP